MNLTLHELVLIKKALVNMRMDEEVRARRAPTRSEQKYYINEYKEYNEIIREIDFELDERFKEAKD